MNTRNRIRALLAGATLVIVAAVVAGLIAIGSPALQRKRKLDDQRVADLSSISQYVKYYWEQHKQLPADLAELGRQPGVRVPSDPETGAAFEYVITGTNAYRLCANFALDSADQEHRRYYSGTDDWPHGAGRGCFDRHATKSSGSD
jgi:hypothetical protein